MQTKLWLLNKSSLAAPIKPAPTPAAPSKDPQAKRRKVVVRKVKKFKNGTKIVKKPRLNQTEELTYDGFE